MFTYFYTNKPAALCAFIIGMLFFGFIGLSSAETPREQDMRRLAAVMDRRETLAPVLAEDAQLAREQEDLMGKLGFTSGGLNGR